MPQSKVLQLSPACRNAIGVSFAAALAYGVFGSSLYEGAPPHLVGAACKASSIVILGLIALFAGSRILGAGLLFGALGDALLAWNEQSFLAGAIAFLIGHLFYITLFLRAGDGARAALRNPWRLALSIATVLAAALASRLTPHDSPLFAPLTLYSAVLTLMVLTSYTLPSTHWPAMLGAALFLISDIFVAWNSFHPATDPTLAFWRSFAGWMIYWAGQTGICVGALGLHKRH